MKGRTNNPFGRPIGSLNKSTTEIKSLITDFIGHNIDTLQTDFDKLEPRDKLIFFEKLLQYAVPKQKEIVVDVSSLSDDEVENLLNVALKKID